MTCQPKKYYIYTEISKNVIYKENFYIRNKQDFGDIDMGYYNKNWKKHNNNHKPGYRKPPYDPAKAALKKAKEEEKKKTKELLEYYIPIFQSLDILHCIGMFTKVRKKLTTPAKQIIKMLIINKLIYHNPMLPYQGELPDEVQEVNEYIERYKVDLKVVKDEEKILKLEEK